MLASIIEFSLRQRVIVIVGTVLILFFGTYSFINTPVDAFPDISPTQVKIILKLTALALKKWKTTSCAL